MITDAMLRLAAAEAEHCLLGQLPEPQDHTFTPAFERKIQNSSPGRSIRSAIRCCDM